MSAIETVFKVGEIYKNGHGEEHEVIAIDGRIRDWPVVTVHLTKGGCKTFRANGYFGDGPQELSNLIPPKTLPPLPAGRQWLREEGIFQEMINDGWRPLMLKEPSQDGDEESLDGGKEWRKISGHWMAADPRAFVCARTKRPLPPEKKRVPLGPEDVPPGTFIRNSECRWAVITGITNGGLVLPSKFVDSIKCSFSTAMKEGYEILRPGTNVWLPMWKEVEA